MCKMLGILDDSSGTRWIIFFVSTVEKREKERESTKMFVFIKFDDVILLGLLFKKNLLGCFCANRTMK